MLKLFLSCPSLPVKLSNDKVNKIEEILMIFFHGAAIRSGSGPPQCRGFMITLRLTHSVRLLFMSDQPDAETSYNTQHSSEIDAHAAGGIRTRNPSKGEAADERLRPHGHWDRHLLLHTRIH
jgi:hypothetical protein